MIAFSFIIEIKMFFLKEIYFLLEHWNNMQTCVEDLKTGHFIIVLKTKLQVGDNFFFKVYNGIATKTVEDEEYVV